MSIFEGDIPILFGESVPSKLLLLVRNSKISSVLSPRVVGPYWDRGSLLRDRCGGGGRGRGGAAFRDDDIASAEDFE